MLSILSGARLRLVGEWQWVLANSWSLGLTDAAIDLLLKKASLII